LIASKIAAGWTLPSLPTAFLPAASCPDAVRSRCRARSPSAQARSSAGSRFPAASTIAASASAGVASSSGSPRRLSTSSPALSATLTNRLAFGNTAGEP
jgi:hypothetical protein